MRGELIRIIGIYNIYFLFYSRAVTRAARNYRFARSAEGGIALNLGLFKAAEHSVG